MRRFTHGFGLAALTAVTIAVVVAVVLLVFGGGGSEGPPAPHPYAYLSLGDSLAAGEGASVPGGAGFAALVFAGLQHGGGGGRAQEFVSMGRSGGETTVSMIDGQLLAALAEIAARKATASTDDDIGVITLSIGGNDAYDVLPVCASATVPIDSDSDCGVALIAGIGDIGTNLNAILAQLRKAAGPHTRIVVLTYPNSLVGCSLAALALIGEVGLEGDDKTIQGLNGVIRDAARANGAIVAEGYGRLVSADFIGGSDCKHPNDSGHAKLAQAVLAALGAE